MGLFELALANYLSLYVDLVYGNPAAFERPAHPGDTFAFGWQIYFDFSGYTDMAQACAMIMGFRPDAELPQSLHCRTGRKTFGPAGTSASPPGSRITSTSLSAAIDAASSAPTET